MKIEDLSPAERRQVAAGRANISAGGRNPRGPQKAETPRRPTGQPTATPAEPNLPAGLAPELGEKAASPNGFLSPARRAAPRAAPVWQCHTCGQQFTALTPAQRHCDTEKHCRLDWLLPPGWSE